MGQCEKDNGILWESCDATEVRPQSVAFLSICPSFRMSVTTTLYVFRVDDCLCGDICLICIDTMLAEIVRDVIF